MSDKVISLFEGQPSSLREPQPELVHCLEDLLERARSGEIQSLVATGFCANGYRLSLWAGAAHENVHEMLGAIAWLQHEYVARVTEKIEEER